jgi:competence protein ComGC
MKVYLSLPLHKHFLLSIKSVFHPKQNPQAKVLKLFLIILLILVFLLVLQAYNTTTQTPAVTFKGKSIIFGVLITWCEIDFWKFSFL